MVVLNLNNGSIKNPAEITKNCFFLWSNGLILSLSVIPLISFLISKVFNIPVWHVPKIYELKMYALALLFCASLSALTTYFPEFFRKTYVKYQTYLLFYYPFSILLYSFISMELLRYLSIFILTIIGFTFFCLDMGNKKSASDSFFYKYYNILFLISLATSIFIIMYFANDLTFTLSTSWRWIASLFIFVFIFLKWIKINSRYCVWILPLLLFTATFWSMGGEDLTHYGFFLGPVIESMYGHYHPLVLDVQYGGGLTTFLVLYFKLIGLISFKNMQFLLKILTFVQFMLIYGIGVSIYQSRKIAFLVLLTTLFFSFYSVNGWLYYMAPSIGFIRFGYIYIILYCYTLQEKFITQKTTDFLTAILGSLAFIWSFESAIYTLPALFFAEYVDKNLKKFLPIFLICFIAILTLYLFPFALERKYPPISQYYEYALLYARGLAQISMGNATNFWWLFPLLYGFMLIKIIVGEINNKIIVALTIYGMAVFTYFGGRAHPSALLNVAIPFVLLTAYLSLHLKLSSALIKQIVFSLTLVAFFTVNNVLFPGVEIKVLWERNIPFLKESFLAFIGQPNQMSIYDQSNDRKCAALYNSLKKYIEYNSLAILSIDDKLLLHMHVCTKTYNSLLMVPILEVVINPAAIDRARERAANLINQYILVDTKLIDTEHPFLFYDLSKITMSILEKMRLSKINELEFGDTTLAVFSRKSNLINNTVELL